MTYYEKLYLLKDDKKLIQERLDDFLLFQVYSPTILRKAYARWPELPWFIRENTPEDIQRLIEKSSHFSDKAIQLKLNEYYIRQAVDVLSKYQACDTPITQDPTVPKNRYKLTSKQGDKALLILQNALKEKQFSDTMADLAIHTSHKFLSKDKYYIQYKFSKKMASSLAWPDEDEAGQIHYEFPTIQLTKGCMNRCSHCDSKAEPHLSHMPWPIFRSLYRGLNKHYQHYQQKKVGRYFASFFADSDMLDYRDPIMKVDAGDAGLWLAGEEGHCQYLTRGVKNEGDKLALAKALVSGRAIAISFVDTPCENQERAIKQLNETLDVVESVPQRAGNPAIIHVHLKNGPCVSDSLFRGFLVEQKIIHSLGRANNFPKSETDNYPDERWLPKFIFQPSGDLVCQEVKNSELCFEKLNNLFKHQHGPQISPVRLFIRHHILSRIK